MGVYGWRLIGVTGTLLVYVAGIIFLSVSNIPGPHHPKRVRISRFGELPKIQPHELMSINRRTQILWCKELKFLDGTPNLPAEAQKEFIVRKPYFKHNSKNAFKFNNINQNHKIQLPKPTATSSHSDFKNSTTNSTASKKDDPGVLIALASFPGSGNTWLRYLLQQSTGILTGSIYKDYGLLKSGFPAENICNTSVLVVKTHEWGPKALGTFDKAILLVRDPDKAILAEFNRQSGGHVGFASPDRYKRIKGRYWQQFVRNKLNGWEEMNLDWAKNFTGDLKIVFYDDLVKNVEQSLREILRFINFDVDESLMNCAMLRKEGIFRRKKRPLTFDPYTNQMHKSIEETKERVYKLLGKS